MDGRSDTFIVKRNYRGEGVSVEEVFRDPTLGFDTTAVMFRREEGYAPKTGNWVWAKFTSTGEVATTPNGRPMAGLVGACISCHSQAQGEDLVVGHDRFAQ